jgi:hypothetical protein
MRYIGLGRYCLIAGEYAVLGLVGTKLQGKRALYWDC